MKNKYCPVNHDLMTDNFVCAVCKALEHQREDMEKELKQLRDGELGRCPDCDKDGKHYYPCWHQELRFEALDQAIQYLKRGDKLPVKDAV